MNIPMITKEDAIYMYWDIVNNGDMSTVFCDETLLDSALNAPYVQINGADAFPTPYLKAARLGYGLVKNHAFTNGNKRIAVHLMLLCLALYDIYLDYTDDEMIQFIVNMTQDKYTIEEIAEWLEQHMRMEVLFHDPTA